MSELVLTILELFHRIEIAILYLVAAVGVGAVGQLVWLAVYLRDRREAQKELRVQRAVAELEDTVDSDSVLRVLRKLIR